MDRCRRVVVADVRKNQRPSEVACETRRHVHRPQSFLAGGSHATDHRALRGMVVGFADDQKRPATVRRHRLRHASEDQARERSMASVSEDEEIRLELVRSASKLFDGVPVDDLHRRGFDVDSELLKQRATGLLSFSHHQFRRIPGRRRRRRSDIGRDGAGWKIGGVEIVDSIPTGGDQTTPIAATAAARPSAVTAHKICDSREPILSSLLSRKRYSPRA